MHEPLEAVKWRLERADEHLATLNAERDAFLRRVEENGRPIVGEFERDVGEYVFRVDVEPPDPRIGLVVGEFAHNLRAALDNVLWQVVLLRGGSPTKVTQFPIHESREGYRDDLKRGVLRGISADDRAFIEGCQPFQGGERSADSYLVFLAWLNNVDKHRFIHVGGAIARTIGMKVSYGSEGEFAGWFPWYAIPVKDVAKVLDVRYVSLPRSEDRTEIMRVAIETSGPEPQMEVRGDAPLEVAVSDPEHALILKDLIHIRGLVQAIVDGFAPRFEVVGGAG